jgi:hypothetical protein
VLERGEFVIDVERREAKSLENQTRVEKTQDLYAMVGVILIGVVSVYM